MVIRTADQKRCYKLLFILVKYIPMVSAFMLWLHVVLFFFNIHEYYLDNLFDSSIPRAALLIVASYAFGFCRKHRIFIAYNWAITAAIDYNHNVGFTDIQLLLHEVGFIIIGICLFIDLWKHRIQFIKCCGNGAGTFKTILENMDR